MRLVVALASTTGSNLLVFVLATANSILLTRLLGTGGRGEFALFTASSALFTLILSFGLDFALNYYVARGELPRSALLTSVVGYSSGAASVFFLLVVLNNRLLRNEFFLPTAKHQLPYELLLALLLFSTLVSANVRSVFAGLREFHAINKLTVLVALSSLVAYGAIHVVTSRSALPASSGELLAVYTGLALAGALASVLAAAVQLRLPWSLSPIPWPLARRMFRTGLTAYAGTILQFLNYRVDFWVLRYFTDAATLGLYSLASTLAQLLWLVPRSVSSVLFSVYAAGDRDDVRTQVLAGQLALLVSILGAVGAASISGYLIPLLYGEDFAPAALPFAVLLFGCAPFAATIVWASGLAAKGLQIQNAQASFVGFVATVIFDLLLIPRFQVVGAAVASSASYLITTTYVAICFARAYEVTPSRLVLPHRGDLLFAWATLKALWTRARDREGTRDETGAN